MTVTALDTNILSGLVDATNPFNERISAALSECRKAGRIVISAPVFAELLANPHIAPGFLDAFLRDTEISVDFVLDEPIWRLAGERFALYAARRRHAMGAPPRRLLADFLIGAHALATVDRLFTFDTKVYRQDFPELRLYPEPTQ